MTTGSPSNLSETERQYVLFSQKGLPICEKPYHWLAQRLDLSVDDTLTMTKDLQARGIIRRIAAVPNHYKIGYKFNGMTTWDIADEQAIEFGEKVGALPFVSHCYLRPRHLPEWNYNLFAMIHGKNEQELEQYRAEIKELLAEVLQTHQGKSCEVLTSTRILKKTGLRLKNKNEASPVK